MNSRKQNIKLIALFGIFNACVSDVNEEQILAYYEEIKLQNTENSIANNYIYAINKIIESFNNFLKNTLNALKLNKISLEDYNEFKQILIHAVDEWLKHEDWNYVDFITYLYFKTHNNLLDIKNLINQIMINIDDDSILKQLTNIINTITYSDVLKQKYDNTTDKASFIESFRSNIDNHILTEFIIDLAFFKALKLTNQDNDSSDLNNDTIDKINAKFNQWNENLEIIEKVLTLPITTKKDYHKILSSELVDLNIECLIKDCEFVESYFDNPRSYKMLVDLINAIQTKDLIKHQTACRIIFINYVSQFFNRIYFLQQMMLLSID